LGQPDLAHMVKTVLAETGLDPKYLEFELTESAMIPDAQLAVGFMSEIHRIGVQTAIDNFGSGYASLNYLKHFPVDMLHIHWSYVRDIGTDLDGTAIAHSVIALGHSLDMKVLAKGVETQVQLDVLRAHDCDMMQGYLFSKPLPPDEVAALLREGRSLPIASERH